MRVGRPILVMWVPGRHLEKLTSILCHQLVVSTDIGVQMASVSTSVADIPILRKGIQILCGPSERY